jgi:hypothetical protein
MAFPFGWGDDLHFLPPLCRKYHIYVAHGLQVCASMTQIHL